MSLKNSCSWRFFVPVEMTIRLPDRIAGMRYASVLPVPVPASTIRWRFPPEPTRPPPPFRAVRGETHTGRGSAREYRSSRRNYGHSRLERGQTSGKAVTRLTEAVDRNGWWTGKDSNLRTSQGGTDLQSVGFNHSPTRPRLCWSDIHARTAHKRNCSTHGRGVQHRFFLNWRGVREWRCVNLRFSNRIAELFIHAGPGERVSGSPNVSASRSRPDRQLLHSRCRQAARRSAGGHGNRRIRSGRGSSGSLT